MNAKMLEGMSVVVTGASRGIGRAIALKAAECGALVGINYHKSEDQAGALAEEITAAGLAAPVLLRFDASKGGEIERGIEMFLKSAGRIDGWVNNAAINCPGLLPTIPEEEIRTQVESALIGPILCCRSVIPHMMARRSGSIVNIGSIVSEKVSRGQSVYAAAKGGVLALTRALACEYGRKGIRVNCILPGAIETDMFETTKELAGGGIMKDIPLNRFGQPEDVAGMAAFLLGGESAYISGACINVDGGYSIT